MWLDRSLIKKQAKELIKNRVLKLFGITLIIFIILNAFSTVYNITNYNNIFSAFNEYNDYGGYEDYFNENFGDGRNSYADEFKQFDNSGNSSFEEEFNNFGTDSSAQNYEDNFNSFGGHIALPAAADAQTAALGGFSVNYTLNLLTFAIALVVIFLAPLSVALSYFYVEYVTGKEFEFDSGLKSVFRNAFNCCSINCFRHYHFAQVAGIICNISSVIYLKIIFICVIGHQIFTSNRCAL